MLQKKTTILFLLFLAVILFIIPDFINEKEEFSVLNDQKNEKFQSAEFPEIENQLKEKDENPDFLEKTAEASGISEEVIKETVLDDNSLRQKILLNPPFASQAPFGDWSDQRQQDGCEEASALMAVYWAKNKGLSKEEALKEIISISDYLLETYGEYRDISSADTVEWIFKDYLNFFNVELKKNILLEDIIKELQKGNLVISPMNGQALGNPNFTPPGPPRHMLVIKGYDPEKNVFITNDPGTRNGESYVYNTDVLFEAIRDYPTGYHETIQAIEKNMIVVSR